MVVTAKGRLSLTAGSEVGVGIVEANGLSKLGRRTAVLGEVRRGDVVVVVIVRGRGEQRQWGRQGRR